MQDPGLSKAEAIQGEESTSQKSGSGVIDSFHYCKQFSAILLYADSEERWNFTIISGSRGWILLFGKVSSEG